MLDEIKRKDARIADLEAAIQREEQQKRSPERSRDDLEAKFAQLTDSLLQKQALLEAVSAEKTSLVLQIERLEVRKKEQFL